MPTTHTGAAIVDARPVDEARTDAGDSHAEERFGWSVTRRVTHRRASRLPEKIRFPRLLGCGGPGAREDGPLAGHGRPGVDQLRGVNLLSSEATQSGGVGWGTAPSRGRRCTRRPKSRPSATPSTGPHVASTALCRTVLFCPAPAPPWAFHAADRVPPRHDVCWASLLRVRSVCVPSRSCELQQAPSGAGAEQTHRAFYLHVATPMHVSR